MKRKVTVFCAALIAGVILFRLAFIVINRENYAIHYSIGIGAIESSEGIELVWASKNPLAYLADETYLLSVNPEQTPGAGPWWIRRGETNWETLISNVRPIMREHVDAGIDWSEVSIASGMSEKGSDLQGLYFFVRLPDGRTYLKIDTF